VLPRQQQSPTDASPIKKAYEDTARHRCWDIELQYFFLARVRLIHQCIKSKNRPFNDCRTSSISVHPGIQQPWYQWDPSLDLVDDDQSRHQLSHGWLSSWKPRWLVDAGWSIQPLAWRALKSFWPVPHANWNCPGDSSYSIIAAKIVVKRVPKA